MRRGYGEPAARPRHPRVGPAPAIGDRRRRRWRPSRWRSRSPRGGGTCRSPRVASPPSCGRRALGVAVAALAAAGVWRADAAWAALRPDALGPFAGWATVVGEPERAAGADRVVVERRRRALRGVGARPRPPPARRTSGRPATGCGSRASARRAGARSATTGRVAARRRRARRRVVRRRRRRRRRRPTRRTGCAALIAPRRRRAAAPTGPRWPAGCVIGDDRDEPPAMIERFRAAGLIHLTAVSGQNVALLLAAAGPLLRRARPPTRWVATLGADRLVRGAHARRAVGAAGRGDGGARRHRVRARAPGRAAPAARRSAVIAPAAASTRCWRGRSASGCRSGPRPA